MGCTDNDVSSLMKRNARGVNRILKIYWMKTENSNEESRKEKIIETLIEFNFLNLFIKLYFQSIRKKLLVLNYITYVIIIYY